MRVASFHRLKAEIKFPNSSSSLSHRDWRILGSLLDYRFPDSFPIDRLKSHISHFEFLESPDPSWNDWKVVTTLIQKCRHLLFLHVWRWRRARILILGEY